MNGYSILVFVICVIYKVTATFPMSPFSMGLGRMHMMGSPFGFGGMGFGMPVLKKIYNPLTNTFIVQPFLINPHMAMGMRQPFMFNPHAMNMMRPPLAPMGFGHMGHMGAMGPRPMGMGMGFPPRYPPRYMPYRRPMYPSMRRPYIPRAPMRTPSAYYSSRGPATSYRHTTYQTRYGGRPYSRYSQYRPVVHSSVARTPAVYRDVEMEIDTDDVMKNVAFYNRFDTGNDYIHMQSPYAKNSDDYYKVSDEFKLNGQSFWMGDDLEAEDGVLGAMLLGGLGAPAQSTVTTVQSPNTMANAAALATANSAASYSNNVNNRVAANIPVNTIPVVTTNAQATVNGGISGGQASAVAQTAASAAAASAAQATSAAQAAVSAAQSAASSAATGGTSSLIIPTKIDDDKGLMRLIGRNNLIQQGGNDLNSINTAVNAISSIVPTNTGTVVSPMIMGGKDMFDDKMGGPLALNSLNTGVATTNTLNTGLNVANNLNVQSSGLGSTTVFNDLGLGNNVVGNTLSNTNNLLGIGGTTTTVTDTFIPPMGFGDKFFGFKFD